jgi:hypothetical protein
MPSSELLKLSQEKLVKQIFESHNFFLLYFYGAILNLLLFATFNFILGLYLASTQWEILIYCFPGIIIIVAILRKIRGIPSLISVSSKALKKIEKLSVDDKLQTGITNYINQVSAAIQALMLPKGEEWTLASNGTKIEFQKFSFEFVAYGFVVVLILSIMYFIYPDAIAQPNIAIALSIVIAVTVIRFFIYQRWISTIERWLKAYYGLLSWEEKVVSGEFSDVREEDGVPWETYGR